MAGEVPAVLQGDHTVRVVRGEHRGAIQYHGGRIHGYKMVIDISRRPRLSISENETWLITPERVIGNIVFCWPQRKLLNADGLHPVVSATKSYAERGCRVSVTVGNNRFEGRLRQVQVNADEVVRLIFTDGTNQDLVHFFGKIAPYGRYSGEAYQNSRRVHVVFWEN